MPLETSTYISGLNASNPAAGDGLGQADDHLRLLKSTIKTTFPNISGAVTATHTQINQLAASTFGAWTFTGAVTLAGGTSVDGSGNVIIGIAPSSGSHATTKTYVDTADALKVDKTITVTGTGGLTGGGALSANREISIASGSNGYGSRTVSSSSPSGGSDGDIWYKTS